LGVFVKGYTLGGAAAPAIILFCLFGSAAFSQEKPAVSGINGKFEFSAGALTLPTPSFVGRVAGALTVPLGDRFGLQADFSVSSTPGYTLSAALHAFTRDPSNYLLGASAGFVKSSGALVIAAGPEGELYRDRVSLEGWAGVSMVDPSAPGPTRFGVFALGTVAYYPTDNWRVSVGVSSLDNYAALQIGSEYLLDTFDMPVAVTGEARIGQDGGVRVLLGLRGYVGPDPHKSLIARQREDDPADLGSALYGAAGRTTLYGDTASPKSTKDAAASDTESAQRSGNAENHDQSGGQNGDGSGDQSGATDEGSGNGANGAGSTGGGGAGAAGGSNDVDESVPDWCKAHGTTVPSWIFDASDAVDGGVCQDVLTFEIYHKNSV
jgi:hypothetical protein